MKRENKINIINYTQTYSNSNKEEEEEVDENFEMEDQCEN